MSLMIACPQGLSPTNEYTKQVHADEPWNLWHGGSLVQTGLTMIHALSFANGHNDGDRKTRYAMRRYLDREGEDQ